MKETALRELAHRQGDGIDVTLRWRPEDDAVVLLAGIASVLWSGPASTFLDDPGGGVTTVAAWAVFGGAIYGAAVIWAGGLLLHLVARRLGSLGSYQRARHVVGFSLAPLALSLLTIWPVRLV